MKQLACLGILLLHGLAISSLGQNGRLPLDDILTTEENDRGDPGVLSPHGHYFAIADHGHIKLLPTDEQLGIHPAVAHFHGSDGLPLAGILYKPANFALGKRYPTVIWAHGGPEAQETLTLSPWSLYLAQQGYVVFEPNFRGSTGYGERFRNSNVEDSGGGEIRDIASSVQCAHSRKIIRVHGGYPFAASGNIADNSVRRIEGATMAPTKTAIRTGKPREEPL